MGREGEEVNGGRVFHPFTSPRMCKHQHKPSSLKSRGLLSGCDLEKGKVTTGLSGCFTDVLSSF